MTYKKVFIYKFIFFLIAVVCVFVFENPVLNTFILLLGMGLSSLLKGYAKDNENKKETLSN